MTCRQHAVRILFAASRNWFDEQQLASALLEAVHWSSTASGAQQGQPAVTLVHGRCNPRLANGAAASWDWAINHPERGPFHGGDWLAHHFALSQGWFVEAHPADWERFGLAAGPIRNQEMVATGATVAVGLILGRSDGTRGCMKLARAAGIPVRTRVGVPR